MNKFERTEMLVYKIIDYIYIFFFSTQAHAHESDKV
jgi:hypothetical protein